MKYNLTLFVLCGLVANASKDGLTDGGLGDVNPARSLREIQMLGHGREVTQVTQFHPGGAPYRKQLSVKE
jgi:hypothetical protein